MVEVNPNVWKPQPVSPFNPPKRPPGFLREAATQWTLGPINQSLFRAEESLFSTPEPGFNPWAHLSGFEQYADTLLWARSRSEIDAMKTRIRFNEAERDIQARGQWGMTAALFGGLFDPINLIPVPITRGMGFMKGAAVGAASNAAIATVTDPIRIASDPTASWNELAYSIGGAALFGAALGGASGTFLTGKARADGVAKADRFVAELSELEGTNVARVWNAAEENYNVVTGRAGLGEDGRYEPVQIEVLEVPLREQKGPDGNLYHYDDSFGWVLEADRGSPEPRPVPQDIMDALGSPKTSTELRMKVDEAALKTDFEQGRHFEAEDGVTPLKPDDIRTPREYVTFKQIEAVWKRREPRKAGESLAAYKDRIRGEALRELKGARAAASPKRAWLLENINFSPVAKAGKIFASDPVLGDLPLQLAGDYGWMIRANEFGYKTPPSLLLRAMRHNLSHNEVRQALDAHWLKYAQRNANATGTSFMGQNVTAAAEAWKATAKSMTGQKVLTKRIFAEMAGRAVFDKDPFTVDGFEVVPEAREVAKAWTRVAQKYDKEARELGVFYDQQGLVRTLKVAEEKIGKLKSDMAAWLWGETGEPSALTPAIRVKVKQSDFLTPDAGIYEGYHGSTKGFTSFDRSKLGEFTGAQSAKEGFFFSKTAATANTYAEPGRLAEDKLLEHFKVLEQQSQELIDAHNSRYDELQKAADEILFPLGGVFETKWDRDGWSVIDTTTDFGVETLSDQEIVSLWGQQHLDQKRALEKAYEQVAQMVAEFNIREKEARKIWAEVDNELGSIAFDLKGPAPEGSSVHPVKLVMRNPYVWDQRGESYRERKFTEIVQTAKREGHDSAIIKNTFDTWGDDYGDIQDDIYIVFDEDQIVSVFDAPRVAEAQAMGEREVEQVFTGDTHEAAIERLLMANPDFDVSSLTPDSRGFIARSEAQAIAPPADPKLDHDPGSGTYHMDGQEITREEYLNESMSYQQRLDEWRAQVKAQPERTLRKFRSSDQLVKDRIDSLTEAQRYVYDQWQDQLDRLEQYRAAADLQLKAFKDQPHTFRDQYGEPEPFFARFWTTTKLLDPEQRRRFERILTHWYRRDNPVGAEQRATQTVDNMLKAGDAEDERMGSVPGLRHLHKRTLDIPNSFKVNDPELGEIAVAEFFNTDIETVSEAYTRGMGHKIEAARMFGDADLWQKMNEAEDHWRETVLRPAAKKGASREELQALRAQFDEYAGWIDIIKRGMLGGLKTKDPWSLSGRTARNLKNFQILTSMGRILLTSIPEAMRLPMVNGFRDGFSGLWLRVFGDLKQTRANIEFSRESGEILDLVRDVHLARIAELNQPDPGGGGTYIEKLMERAVPGFLKLVGQTHWTVMAKDAVMFTAQHKVMKLALDIDNPKSAEKLAALGIGRREAKLLASMPYETHGRIILPSVDQWQGAEGRRARTLLLDAIHGEARRAIVTPSFADKSLLFSGIAARNGKVVFENDLMTVPLQFMSYGMAAHQKVLVSGLQGRDQNFVMGAFAMFLAGVMSNYLKQPQTATMNKSTTEWLIEGYESSGVGGFWFSDLNQMIERYSYNTLGLRPITGTDPRFGKTTNIGDMFDAAGPSIGTIADVANAFLDPERSATNRAQAIRRAVPYNNVIWWGWMARDLANATGRSFQE